MTTMDNDNDRPQKLQRPELRGDPITRHVIPAAIILRQNWIMFGDERGI